MVDRGQNRLVVEKALEVLAFLWFSWPKGPPSTPTANQGTNQTDPKEITNSIGMKLVLISPGKFLMGSPTNEPERQVDEYQHEVEITKPYFIGVYEVTQNEYEKVTGKNPSNHSPTGGGKDIVIGLDTRRFPVENVSWKDAIGFCQQLSDLPEERKAGRTYRLPTEAEWEYACRAGTTTPFFFGTQASSRDANFQGEKPYNGAAPGPRLGRTAPVGSYKANAWGLFDLHGNVAEWCQDWYDAEYYRTSPVKDPQGPGGSGGELRKTCRDAAYMVPGWGARSACRGKPPINYTEPHVGFRAAMALEKPTLP